MKEEDVSEEDTVRRILRRGTRTPPRGILIRTSSARSNRGSMSALPDPGHIQPSPPPASSPAPQPSVAFPSRYPSPLRIPSTSGRMSPEQTITRIASSSSHSPTSSVSRHTPTRRVTRSASRSSLGDLDPDTRPSAPASRGVSCELKLSGSLRLNIAPCS